jgi:hypothetical protein
MEQRLHAALYPGGPETSMVPLAKYLSAAPAALLLAYESAYAPAQYV